MNKNNITIHSGKLFHITVTNMTRNNSLFDTKFRKLFKKKEEEKSTKL